MRDIWEDFFSQCFCLTFAFYNFLEIESEKNNHFCLIFSTWQIMFSVFVWFFWKVEKKFNLILFFLLLKHTWWWLVRILLPAENFSVKIKISKKLNSFCFSGETWWNLKNLLINIFCWGSREKFCLVVSLMNTKEKLEFKFHSTQWSKSRWKNEILKIFFPRIDVCKNMNIKHISFD